MTHREFEDIVSWGDLVNACDEECCYVCEDIEYGESLHTLISDDLYDRARYNGDSWTDIRDWLNGIDICDDCWYIRDDYGEWRELDDYDFNDYKDDFYSWLDENDAWEDDEEEPDCPEEEPESVNEFDFELTAVEDVFSLSAGVDIAPAENVNTGKIVFVNSDPVRAVETEAIYDEEVEAEPEEEDEDFTFYPLLF